MFIQTAKEHLSDQNVGLQQQTNKIIHKNKSIKINKEMSH